MEDYGIENSNLFLFPILLLNGFTLKPFREQTESFSSLTFRRNTFGPATRTQIQTNRDQFDSIKGIGLAIANVLLKNEESSSNFPKPTKSSLVLLASNNLKIKIPHLPLFSHSSPAKSQTDFGIKTRRNPVSLSAWKKTLSESLSASEMVLSEDYTRVTSYGPNPRTIHIFDDCVVESCCGKGLVMNMKERFLSFSCYRCKKNLEQGEDLYMYRGEKAFCSHECRQIEIMLEEIEEKEEDHVGVGTHVNLQAQGVWEAVMFDEVDERKDRMALATIYQALPDDVLLMVAEKDSAKLTWETLKAMHVGVERVKEIVTAIEQFGDLNNMTIEEIVGRLKVHKERLCGYGDKEEENLFLMHDE
ncbi:FCS-Like Zinc finger 8-like [Impatiens glandulifera]|uniref:FCS-Like Zinc finger 8-like n=1 Tax=Impatiens glandulifera TaxID=253017 RepID=UPI001FB054B5|nr:FCS-Like Zinc finger 8-like [Impatiens glandulifera]